MKIVRTHGCERPERNAITNDEPKSPVSDGWRSWGCRIGRTNHSKSWCAECAKDSSKRASSTMRDGYFNTPHNKKQRWRFPDLGSIAVNSSILFPPPRKCEILATLLARTVKLTKGRETWHPLPPIGNYRTSAYEIAGAKRKTPVGYPRERHVEMTARCCLSPVHLLFMLMLMRMPQQKTHAGMGERRGGGDMPHIFTEERASYLSERRDTEIKLVSA